MADAKRAVDVVLEGLDAYTKGDWRRLAGRLARRGRWTSPSPRTTSRTWRACDASLP